MMLCSQLRVIGHRLFELLSFASQDDHVSVRHNSDSAQLAWKLIGRGGECKPQELICVPEKRSVVIVEVYDTSDIERIRLLEAQVHAYLKYRASSPLVLCPMIMVIQSPDIFADLPNLPDIVSDWIFMPVSVPELNRRISSALKRKGLLAIRSDASLPGRYVLSEREMEILRMATRGLNNKHLAQQLFISETTVKWHLRNIYLKFSVNNRNAALARAREFGLL